MELSTDKVLSVLQLKETKFSDGTVRKLNLSEANFLAAQTFPGTKNSILNSNKYILYEVCSLLEKLGWDQVLKLLKNDNAFSDLNSEKKSRNLVKETTDGILFGNELLKEPQLRELTNIEIFKYKDSVTEGAFDCPRCKSKNTTTLQKQVRSADEPMTNFNTCKSCTFKWKN